MKGSLCTAYCYSDESNPPFFVSDCADVAMKERRYRIVVLSLVTFGITYLFILYSNGSVQDRNTAPLNEVLPSNEEVTVVQPIPTTQKSNWNFLQTKAQSREKNVGNESRSFVAKILQRNKAKNVKAVKRKPIILLWIPPATPIDWTIPETATCGGGCIVTKNRSLYTQSDAVVFFMKGLALNVLPNPRTHSRERKVYTWWCEESPWTVRNFYRKSIKEYNNYFNWTMHYKPHSDVLATLMPHTARDWLLHRVGRGDEATIKTPVPGFSQEEFDEAFDKLMKVKTKSAVAVITDCEFTKGAKLRMTFVKEIERHYNVDQFGACNHRPLVGTNSVFHNHLRQYKFHFAFENTLGCNDYVTEKFWTNSLYAGCVPVVWGPTKANMERLAPPNSFIHAEDFNYDAKLLAAYLREVENDDTKYKQYFSWWKGPNFFPLLKLREPKDERDKMPEQYLAYQVSAHCHLCKKLSDGDHLHQTKIVADLHKDFFGGESRKCYT